MSHPPPSSDGLEYESVSSDGEIVQYNFIRRDQQKKEIFKVELQYEDLKKLVAKLSEYLSEVAKVVIKTN